MQALQVFGIFILILVIVYTPMFGLHYLIKYILKKANNTIPNEDFNNMNPVEVNSFLLEKFPYYKALDEPNRSRFLGRLQRFIQSKQFIPAGGTIITQEMVLLISASAIQLTFGLDNYLLQTFKRIFIYPKEFYSKINKRYHKGETNLGGAIIFSWKNFSEGLSKSDDNYNLGLHEMAHALRFNKFKSDEYDAFFNQYFEKWILIANDEYHKLQNKIPSYLREYAGINKEEFFAVCVEQFFETPHEFKKQLPEIYKHLCILLNQDPTQNFDAYHRLTVLNKKPLGNNIDETEIPIFETTNRYQAIVYSKVTLFVFITLLSTIAAQKSTPGKIGFASIIIVLLLMFIGISYFFGKKTFKIYSNRFIISSPLDALFHKDGVFNFDSLVMITFSESEGMNEMDQIYIRYIVDGRISTKTFNSQLGRATVHEMATILVKKKIAVKIEGFKNKSFWY